MLIAIDIDETLTGFPDFFTHLFEVFQKAGDKIGILTGRPQSETDEIIKALEQVGIKPDFLVAMPDDLKKEGYPQGMYKALACHDLGVDVLFDDFLSNDPKMLADFFSLNQKTIPFTSFAYNPEPKQ